MRITLDLKPSPELMELVRMLFTSTITTTNGELQKSFSWPRLPDESEPVELPPSSPKLRHSPNFRSVFETHVLPTLEIEDKPSTISGYTTAVKHFCEWFETLKTPLEMEADSEPKTIGAEMKLRSYGPTLAEMENHPTLLAKFYVFSLKKGEAKTAANKLKNLKTIWRRMYADGHLKKPVPEPRTKLIRKQNKIEIKKAFPIPASNDEIDRLLLATIELREQLTWPNCGIGWLEPWQFWWNAIAVCTVHGFRPGDIWPREAKHGKGLLWSEVSTSASPPIPGGEDERLKADWEFGWIAKETNKTGETLYAPMSPHLRFLIEACRGQDRERVFPITYNGTYFDREFNAIRTRAGLPHVSLCDGAPSASLRKTASVLWRRSAGLAASSHMLCHAIDLQEERSSSVTETHYAGADILRQIVEAYPALLLSLPSQLRC